MAFSVQESVSHQKIVGMNLLPFNVNQALIEQNDHHKQSNLVAQLVTFFKMSNELVFLLTQVVPALKSWVRKVNITKFWTQ